MIPRRLSPFHPAGLTIAAILVIAASAPAPGAAQDSTGGQYAGDTALLWHEASALFPVRVVKPPDFDSSQVYPAVVALHGFGSSAGRFERTVQPFAEADYLVIVPQGPYYAVPLEETGEHWSWGRNSWTPPPLTDDPGVDFATTLLTAETFVASALERVRERYRLGHITVFGFSQGGVYSLAVGFYRRDLVDAIIAFGVWGPERYWYTFRGGEVEDGNATPVLLVLGHQDPLVPFVEAEKGRDVLRDAGYDVTLHEFEGRHTVPPDEVARAIEWLESRRTRD